MYKRQIMELHLEKIELAIDGYEFKQVGRHILACDLLWPRPLISSRQTVKELELEQGGIVFKKLPWHKSVLFKEVVQGPFALSVNLSSPMTTVQMQKLMASVGSILSKSAAGEVDDVIESALLSSVVSQALKAAGKKVSGLVDEYGDWLLEGACDVVFSEGKKDAVTQKIKIPLRLAKDITKTTRRRQQGRSKVKRETVAEKGAPAGEVTLRASLYK